MYDLDPGFVNSLATQAWAMQTEADRRLPGGYKRGKITSDISDAIKSSEVISDDGFVAVGIADIEDLNAVAGIMGKGSDVEIWRILQFGYGVDSPYGGHAVQRIGNQVFYSTVLGRGIHTNITINKGFKGREYFVRLDGDIYSSDYAVVNYIMDYLKYQLNRYSFK